MSYSYFKDGPDQKIQRCDCCNSIAPLKRGINRGTGDAWFLCKVCDKTDAPIYINMVRQAKGDQIETLVQIGSAVMMICQVGNFLLDELTDRTKILDNQLVQIIERKPDESDS